MKPNHVRAPPVWLGPVLVTIVSALVLAIVVTIYVVVTAA